jgi:hypothetical protein
MVRRSVSPSFGERCREIEHHPTIAYLQLIAARLTRGKRLRRFRPSGACKLLACAERAQDRDRATCPFRHGCGLGRWRTHRVHPRPRPVVEFTPLSLTERAPVPIWVRFAPAKFRVTILKSSEPSSSPRSSTGPSTRAVALCRWSERSAPPIQAPLVASSNFRLRLKDGIDPKALSVKDRQAIWI